MSRFNGWRRLGLALCSLALAITAAIAAVEWQAKDSGMFVYRMLLPGSTIEVPTSEVVLPGGKVVRLKEALNGRTSPHHLANARTPRISRTMGVQGFSARVGNSRVRSAMMDNMTINTDHNGTPRLRRNLLRSGHLHVNHADFHR